jgi:hypothetical protein
MELAYGHIGRPLSRRRLLALSGVVGAAGWIADLMPASATETAADDPPVR